MNLHGYFIEKGIDYDSPEAVDIWRDYIAAVTFEVLSASSQMAEELGTTFDGFEGSDWQNGSMIAKMIETLIDDEDLDIGPNSLLDSMHTAWDWSELKERVGEHGLFNQNLQAIPPTGSISYINNSTSSIHPISSKIEIRKEGTLGRVYYPAYGLTNENFDQVKTAYEMDQKAIIDMYAASTPFIDQGQSLTLFYTDEATTRDVNRAQIYAHKAGVKTIYYVRVQQAALEGTEIEGCVSCML
jgi:ribonucleoside-diphosphate reductase alpha chain